MTYSKERDAEADLYVMNMPEMDINTFEYTGGDVRDAFKAGYDAHAKRCEDVLGRVRTCLNAIAEPYKENWSQGELITALRHDEHEALSAIALLTEAGFGAEGK